MAGGRPAIIVDDAFLAKANDYLLCGYLTQEEVCPTVCGLACYLGVSEKTIYNLGERSDEFLQTVEAIGSKQHVLLIAKGLTGDFNPTIAKLMLSSNHGHSEKTVSEVTATVATTNTIDLSGMSDNALEELGKVLCAGAQSQP